MCMRMKTMLFHAYVIVRMLRHVCLFGKAHHSTEGRFRKQTNTFVQHQVTNGNANWIEFDSSTFYYVTRVGVLNHHSSIYPYRECSVLQKYLPYSLNRIHIWQVLPQFGLLYKVGRKWLNKYCNCGSKFNKRNLCTEHTGMSNKTGRCHTVIHE